MEFELQYTSEQSPFSQDAPASVTLACSRYSQIFFYGSQQAGTSDWFNDLGADGDQELVGAGRS